ncbi:MAG: sugar phosphate nucleotidyltransferase [Candidatus Spyradocola sp.]|jgi:hypothetical protein
MSISLVVMAAGIGSRYGGGVKQLESVGPGGELLMEYAVHDAVEAGFDRIVFVLRREIAQDFREIVGSHLESACAARRVDVRYAFQALEDLPEDIRVPDGRTKPWGTCQAVLSAKAHLDGPFAVLNADDYYGKSALRLVYRYLREHGSDTRCGCLAGFRLGNTLSEFGSVTRGLCKTRANGELEKVQETRRIVRTPAGPSADGRALDPGMLVSMNLWGLSLDVLQAIERDFGRFLLGLGTSGEDPLHAEFVLPTAIDALLREGSIRVQVLETPDVWYGMTYREDLPAVREAFRRMYEIGLYTSPLFTE